LVWCAAFIVSSLELDLTVLGKALEVEAYCGRLHLELGLDQVQHAHQTVVAQRLDLELARLDAEAFTGQLV